MKKLLLTLIAVLLAVTLCACGKKNNDPTPKPTPTPKPEPVVQKTVSKIGTDQDIEKMLNDFNAKNKYGSAFYADFDEEHNVMFYQFWDNNDVYRGNYAQYFNHGELPLSELYVVYEDGKQTGTIELGYVILPYEDIYSLSDEQAEPLANWAKACVGAMLPDLSEKELATLLDKIAVPDEEAYLAFNAGQADPAELTETSEDIYLTEDGEVAYTIGCVWDSEYKCINIKFEKK